VAIGSGGGNAVAGREREIDRLHAEVGQLIAFSREVRKMTPRTAERSTIVPTASFRSDANPSCSASRLWCLSARHPPPTNDLGLMRRIDGLFTAWPFPGSRRMRRQPESSSTSARRAYSIQGCKDNA
jgi:hypothetical protein